MNIPGVASVKEATKVVNVKTILSVLFMVIIVGILYNYLFPQTLIDETGTIVAKTKRSFRFFAKSDEEKAFEGEQ